MKTVTLVGTPYRCALALTPDQTAVFIKLMQGAEMVKEGEYNNNLGRYEYERIRGIPEIKVVDETAIMNPADEE